MAEKQNPDRRAYHCPLCSFYGTSLQILQQHVEETHFSNESNSIGENSKTQQQNVSVFECPVCVLRSFKNAEELSVHVETHFSQTSNTKMRKEESNGESSFEELSQRAWIRDAKRGKLTAAEYHERKILQRAAQRTGADDQFTLTEGIVETIRKSLIMSSLVLCSPLSHVSSDAGDQGWGCGYRNFQMLWSCLQCIPMYRPYLEAAVPSSSPRIPSLPHLQKAIESAWTAGFDREGSEQLGGSLKDTKKWIGATEVVALLSSLRIRCVLVDFHKPTARDGTHPELFDWVCKYFSSQSDFKPPLYLQHQGHSRTIIGIEKAKNGSAWNLLVLDPGTKKSDMQQIVKTKSPSLIGKHIRRSVTSFKHLQYQIVAVDGILNEREYEDSKRLKSLRIPAI